ncbi:MAG: hypothetical protein KKC75_04550 [Nanoarchaeota archaeon]|nr:hypothetical protein [Nanoarchaeota archaeon]MBU1005413.1 hypothetical protein [Nanoarchaeota archaeon]MBU1946947.1 hypothetical protein [Nanoarchaeota archaeon]
MIFERSVITIAIVFLLILIKIDKDSLRKFGIILVAVLLFEYFTQALWLNKNLEPWAYLYLDVSWIIAIGWATIILVSIKIIDLYFSNLSERRRFFFYLVPITIIGIVAEGVVLGLGIREYSSAVQRMLSGIVLWNVPIEALYYIPVFMVLVISFTGYWETIVEEKAKPIEENKAKKGSKK